jgi:CRP/FNR family transcriptional regulator, cyclic AMP receptor protein
MMKKRTRAPAESSLSGLIKRCALLDGLSAQDLQRDCPTAAAYSVRQGSAIYYQGKRCDDLFCILEGQIRLARVNREGREVTTALMTIGEFFGPALGAQGARQALETATARGSVTVWRVAAKEFHQLLLNRPVLGLRMVEALTQRQRHTERRLECFVFKRAEARLAETLRELSGAFEPRCEHGFGTHIRLTQQELADLVGATRPVVSTILNRLRKQGVLGYSREYLCVRSIETIEQLIGE